MTDQEPLDYETWYPASERMPPKGAITSKRVLGRDHAGYSSDRSPESCEEWRLVSLPDGWMLPSVEPEGSGATEVEISAAPDRPDGPNRRQIGTLDGYQRMNRDYVICWRYATPLPKGL